MQGKKAHALLSAHYQGLSYNWLPCGHKKKACILHLPYNRLPWATQEGPHIASSL
jgi:hypothetical protein